MTDRARRGRLIAFEGIDGCGKSTQARRLAEHVGAVFTFEPGATDLGRTVRSLILDPDQPPLSPTTEALLLVADRAQHLSEVIVPALVSGDWVVTDRFSASTLAYQGWGRGLDVAALESLNGFATGEVTADLSVLIDLPIETARQRISASTPDRLERLDANFHGRVREGFLALAEGDVDHWLVIDGSSSIDAIAEEITEGVERLLGRP